VTAGKSPDPDRLALGVQQPWAELIVRGLKTVEIRSQATQVRGTIYIYASRKPSTMDAAKGMAARHEIDVDALPKGLLVGTVELIESRPCTPADAAAAGVPADLLVGRQAWILARPQRLPKPLPVRFLPFGVWFYPFKRKTGSEPNPKGRK
jgi:hypothetical protein